MSEATRRQTIFPALSYDDPHGAVEWLERAFGCSRRMVHEGPDGTVAHAELELPGGGILMLGSSSNQFAERAKDGSQVNYVITDDPDALHDRAMAAGAELVHGLTDQPYGSREFAVRDPGGHVWSFGTYDPYASGS